MDEIKNKLNVQNLITPILLVIVMLLGGVLSGIIVFDAVGFILSLIFIGILIFIGYLIDKSGITRYLGWDGQFKQDKE